MIRKVRILDQANVGNDSNVVLNNILKDNYGDTFFRKKNRVWAYYSGPPITKPP